MNPDRKNLGDEASKINEESSSYESIDKDTIDCANSSTIESTEVYPKNNTTANTNQSLTPSSPGSISEAAATLSPEMKRSAVKELIERYFYQLQRGCGNPKCNNKYCASSGEVEQMTPNQIAARAIQLFGMDAKLCDSYNQPSKVPRTQELIPTSSSYSSNYSSGKMAPLPCASPVGQDNGILLPNDNFTGSSNSSSSSTSLSGSHSSTPTTSGTSSSSNKNISNHTRNFIQQPTTATTTTAQLSLTSHPTSNCTELPLATTSSNNPVLPVLPQYLDEKIIDELIEKSKQEENPNYETLINLLGDVFSNYEKLSKSFRKNQNTKSERSSNATTSRENLLLKEKPTDLSNLKKEDLRTLEGETDKDEDSTVFDQDTSEMQDNDLSLPLKAPTNLSDTNVDFQSLRRSIRKIYDLHLETISDTINIAIGEFSGAINVNMRYKSEAESEAYMHGFVICFDLTTCAELDYLESALPKLCHAARRLCVSHHARLAHIWAVHCKEHLRTLVQSFQQIITLEVITDDEYVQESLYITAVTRVLKIAFYANIIAGQMELSKSAPITDVSMSESSGGSSGAAGAPLEEDDFFFYSQISKSSSKFPDDKLEIELGVSAMDCRVPLIPFEEFYNDALSEVIQMDRDYLNYKNLLIDPNGDEELNFTFMRYSFILSPTTKVIALYYDSRIRMFSERSSSLYTLVNFFGDEHEPGMRPDFKLKVRRDNIIDDALVGLEMVAMSNPKDFKKQLVVEFVGEQGIDEGGVSKEFFQLIIEELFNPDFGMFTYQEDTKIVWFNSMPFENEAQFTLIGIILGLAIYNHVILAVNFPMVVYRKLMGGRGSFYDLEDWNPTLYRSLKSLLDYEGDDMEECFMQTFKIGYNDVYGQAVEYELKPGGGDIPVGQHNKQEFVDLYSDYLLNKNIDRQFRAFKKGFDMVTDESPLKLLFRPEEIELLVCGSKKFDFVELEKSTDYEGGYTRESRVIADFWNIVHALPDELKRKLLEFTTGSDRVPVGGLSRLKLLITRHGPDSDRLPTSHTCFNVLLLPEYSSREKLEERLLKAINYSKGFGML